MEFKDLGAILFSDLWCCHRGKYSFEYIRKEGYAFKKAKRVLTSPDPLYKEKLEKITSILANLASNEKFFSVDEFGPCAIKGE